MVDYQEIIRLKSLNFSNLAFANSLGCSCNTVSEVLSLAETHSLEWPITDALNNKDIEHLFIRTVETMRNVNFLITSTFTMNSLSRE